MNTVLENIYTRRSCRSFTEQPIPEEALTEILQAAVCAPSGMNRQTWQFIAITNREKIQRLAQAAAEVLGRENYDMYRPTVLILAANEKESPFAREDNACALENIFLAAHSLGIGSVWLNQLKDICDEPAVRDVLNSFGLRPDHAVFGAAALGYPASPLPGRIEKKNSYTIVE